MSLMSENKLLLIGGSGFIGTSIIQLAAEQGYSIYNIDKKSSDYLPKKRQYIIDILDPETLESAIRKIKPNKIIVLAARTDISSDRVMSYRENIIGTLNILRSLKGCQELKSVLWTSTQLVNHLGNDSRCELQMSPPNSYGESKAICELMALSSATNSSVKTIIVRPTTVWGMNCSPHYLNWFKMIKRNIYFHSGGKDYKKSFGFVKNIAFQYLKLLEAPKQKVSGKIFYLADYEPIGIKEFANLFSGAFNVPKPHVMPKMLCNLIALIGDLLNKFGLPFPYNSFRLKNITTEYVVDMSQTKEICGDVPYSVEQGVELTAKWVKSKF